MRTIEKKYTLLESFLIFVFSGVAVGVIIPLMVVVTFPLTMLTAWIRWTLWNWFAVPYLHVPAVPYWAVVGLGFLVSSFAHTNSPNGYKPKASETFSMIVMPVVGQLICLGIGYIIHTHIS